MSRYQIIENFNGALLKKGHIIRNVEISMAHYKKEVVTEMKNAICAILKSGALKVVYNENQGGSGRWLTFGIGIGS
jgi:hypothetical protein